MNQRSAHEGTPGPALKEINVIPCPYCRSLCTIPIAYGKPGPELERAAQCGLVEIAGCVINETSPSRRCIDCKSGWQDMPPKPNAQFVSDSIVMVQKLRDEVSHLTTAYGANCIEYGRRIAANSGDSMYSFSEMMRDYRDLGQAWERFFVHAQEYCNRSVGNQGSKLFGHFSGEY